MIKILRFAQNDRERDSFTNPLNPKMFSCLFPFPAHPLNEREV